MSPLYQTIEPSQCFKTTSVPQAHGLYGDQGTHRTKQRRASAIKHSLCKSSLRVWYVIVVGRIRSDILIDRQLDSEKSIETSSNWNVNALDGGTNIIDTAYLRRIYLEKAKG